MISRPAITAIALAVFAVPACAQGTAALTTNANSIQPETTISISAEASVTREPDIAFISSGVQTEAETAKEAMDSNALRMNGVFDALSEAGVELRDIQTSNFSLQPRYDYSSRGEQPPRLVGYTASNMLTVKVRDLENLGQTMDSLINAGGNTFSGLRFALEDDAEARDEARTTAMTMAISRAELYAEAAGYRVARIVSITEGGSYSPRPMQMAEMRAVAADSAPTPIASGEVGYNASVNVTFELVK